MTGPTGNPVVMSRSQSDKREFTYDTFLFCASIPAVVGHRQAQRDFQGKAFGEWAHPKTWEGTWRRHGGKEIRQRYGTGMPSTLGGS